MIHEASLWRGVAKTAIAGGYGTAVSLTRTRIHACGNCEQPLLLERWGRPRSPNPNMRHVNVPEDGIPYGVDISVRCRKCRACRAYREKLWMARSAAEAGTASRVWFLTLTFNAESHEAQASRVPGRLRNGAHKYAISAAQKYLKRLRKQSGVRGLRHIWVCELHRSGLPHIHMLLFEQSLGSLNKRMLERSWGLGFVKAKLTIEPDECAKYVVKYMSKAGADCTIRASRLINTCSHADNHVMSITNRGKTMTGNKKTARF